MAASASPPTTSPRSRTRRERARTEIDRDTRARGKQAAPRGSARAAWARGAWGCDEGCVTRESVSGDDSMTRERDVCDVTCVAMADGLIDATMM